MLGVTFYTDKFSLFETLLKSQKTKFGSRVHKYTMLSTGHHNMLFMLVLFFKCQLA